MAEKLPTAQLFRYEKPEVDRAKAITFLCRTDRLIGAVQVIKQGGENNLHAHRHMDGMWMVLAGRARFYGEGNQLLAELGRYEGIMVPRGFQYWFESAGDEDLELLQVEASDVAFKDATRETDRVDYAPPKPSLDSAVVIDGRI